MLEKQPFRILKIKRKLKHFDRERERERIGFHRMKAKRQENAVEHDSKGDAN